MSEQTEVSSGCVCIRSVYNFKESPDNFIYYFEHWLCAIYSEHAIRTEKCFSVILTFCKSNQTLVAVCTVVLQYGLDTCQIKLGFVQVNTNDSQKC